MANDAGHTRHPFLGALALFFLLGAIGHTVAWVAQRLQTWPGRLTLAAVAVAVTGAIVLARRWWRRAGPRWRPRLRALRRGLGRLRTFIAARADLVKVVGVAGLALTVHQALELLGSWAGRLQLVVIAVGLLGVTWLAYRWWRRTRRIPARTKAELQALDPGGFERRVAQWLRADGYRWVQVEGGPGDVQADVTATSPGGAFVVLQCKRYTEGHPVGSPDIQSFAGMVHLEHRADRGLFVTSSRFTAPARELAACHDIGLIDGDEWPGGCRRRPAGRRRWPRRPAPHEPLPEPARTPVQDRATRPSATSGPGVPAIRSGSTRRRPPPEKTTPTGLRSRRSCVGWSNCAPRGCSARRTSRPASSGCSGGSGATHHASWR